MEIFKIESLSFAYPNSEKKALDEINLSVEKGQFIVVCGKSGCGKTTLLRLLKPELSPFGIREGQILFNGKSFKKYSARQKAAQIGFVAQSPENSVVTDKVWHELAFGLESLGYPSNEIRARVAETAAFFGIESLFHKKVCELSGGQKQILSLASVMATQPSVLILDEPSAQLDPIAASELFNVLKKINSELGTTVILSEHRLNEAFPVANRVIVMENGRITADNSPCKIGKILKEQKSDMSVALPCPTRIFLALENADEAPVTVGEGKKLLEEFAEKHEFSEVNADSGAGADANAAKKSVAAIELKEVRFRYEKNLPDVLNGLSMRVEKGEFFAIIGGNGAGKTTALSAICGLCKPYAGSVSVFGKNIMGMLPQNPQTLFTEKSVREELESVLSKSSLEKDEAKRKIREVSELCRITHLLLRHPYDLSGGEKQRAALAKVLLTDPEILLLDEPTKGNDAHFKIEFSKILKDLKNRGKTIVAVSHDIEFCAEYADKCALFFDGKIISCDTSRKFFVGKTFYTTCANRMARNFLPNAVTVRDVISAFGKDMPDFPSDAADRNADITDGGAPFQTKKEIKRENFCENIRPGAFYFKNKFFLFCSLFVFFVLMPLTIFCGVRFFGDRKYYFISLAIIFETIVPFFLAFEKSRPKARELVLISVLCALAVAGRTAFFMLPQFKPTTAIIIIAGVCFGGETGFLVGVITGFISNFFFGQGPWTPWQMFAFGIIGLVSGLLFSSGKIKSNRINLSIFGFLASIFIYGAITNAGSAIIWQGNVNLKMLIAAYSAGFSFDIIHGLSSFVFLFLISEPMIEKLRRIKTKYGLIKPKL